MNSCFNLGGNILRKFIIFAVCLFLLVLCTEEHSAAKEIRSAGRREVMLTFDDGPKEKLTDELLSVLSEHDVKATFFLLGVNVAKYPDLVKKIAADGHLLGNHAHTHKPLQGMVYDDILTEVQVCNALIEKLTGERPSFIRPPHGRLDSNVIKAFEEEGMTLVFWKNNPGDFLGDPGPVLAKKVLTARRNGDIILLHMGLQNVIDALPEIIKSYKEAGFRFVTADQAEVLTPKK